MDIRLKIHADYSSLWAPFIINYPKDVYMNSNQKFNEGTAFRRAAIPLPVMPRV